MNSDQAMNNQYLLDTIQIHNQLCLFMQAFDDKNWSLLRDCLCDAIYCDYSSFRDTPPGEITAEQYVAQREGALSKLVMQHNFSNLRVEVSGDSAATRCNYVIHRFQPDFPDNPEAFFHSYGYYEIALKRIGPHWKISAIIQHLLKNQGNPAIHGASLSG